MTSPNHNTPKTILAALIFFRRQNKDGQNEYLLHQRQNTGFDDGKYSTAGGHVEKGETYLTAAIREAKEETGLKIEAKNLKPSHLIFRIRKDEVRLELGFVITKWTGAPQKNEPYEHGDWEWHAANQLPSKMSNYVRQSIECIEKGIFYSEIQ